LLKNYAAECSVNKVFASEALDAIVDEALQLHGGYGFIQEYEIETLYRDSRINRIFEGTNEINRIVTAHSILDHVDEYAQERTLKGGYSEQLNSQWQLLQELRVFTGKFAKDMDEVYSNVHEEQELLARLADFTTLTYALESSLLRVEKMLKNGNNKNIDHNVRLVKVFAEEAALKYLTHALSISYENNELKDQLTELITSVKDTRI